MISSRSQPRFLAAASAALLLAGVMALFFLQNGTGSTGNPQQAKRKRVLLVGIDGCRSDALAAAEIPNLRALMARGTVTWDAVAGGIKDSSSQQQTVSGPGWASVLCGVWVDKHGVQENKFLNHRLAEFPHFFRRLKEARPGLSTAQAASWPPLEEFILAAAGPGAADRHLLVTQGTYPEKDEQATDAVIAWLRNSAADVTFLYFNNVDETGHALGFSTLNPFYMDAIARVDGQIGRVLAAIRRRAEFADEDWLTVVTTDHGGRLKNHGGQSEEERRVFLIISGGSWPQGKVSADTPGQPVVPSVIAEHLNIPVAAAWGWEPGWRLDK